MRTKLRNDRRGPKILEDGTLPRPLQRSVPREVALNGAGWVAAVCAAALLLAGVARGPLLAQKLMKGSARAMAAAILPAAWVPGALLIVFLLRRQTRLLREGRAVMARVISTEKSKYDDSWSVTYSWSLLSGAVRKANMSRSTELAGSGSFVPVVYDPDQPQRHSVYPLSLVRLR